jgi:hypothetical protein
MATLRKGTKGDGAPVFLLSEQQQTAVDLIVSGRNLQEAADQIGVARATVSGWKNHDPAFQAALNKRRQEAWGEMVDGLRALVPEAVAVLREALLDGPERLAAAVHVLKAAGLYGGGALPPGSTDPELIAAEMQLAEDARQHAQAEADLAIERRAQTRFSNQLLNSFQPGDALAWAQTGGETP